MGTWGDGLYDNDSALDTLGALVQGPVERFSHPKFGAGTLLARSRTGDADTLELRFDDGVIRKVLARFLAAIEA